MKHTIDVPASDDGVIPESKLDVPDGHEPCTSCKGRKVYKCRYRGQEKPIREDYGACSTCNGTGLLSARGHKQTCPSRMQQLGPWERAEGIDRWDFVVNDLCCSFCGSMHPDRFMELVRESIKPESKVGIEWATGKGYKVYVHRKEVVNSSAGGIKFYMWHLPEALQTVQTIDLINQAAKVSWKRMFPESQAGTAENPKS